jgi:glycosyltransferase involved in cell wall biosynthesis
VQIKASLRIFAELRFFQNPLATEDTAAGFTRIMIRENPESMQASNRPRVVLVHDWLTGMRGGEKCLEVLCELFPDAPIYTLLAFPERLSGTIASRDIRTSFLQKMPGIETRYRHYLPLFPRAIESLRLPDCDIVVSSSHAVAKGVKPPTGALHVSYVHTPMRYVWDMYEQYFGKERVGALQRMLIAPVARRLRRWDVRTCDRVHRFIANSEYIRERILRHYGRDAAVIYPPVDTQRFRLNREKAGYYLVLSALVPYKRVDLAVAAFSELGLPLRVIGDGPEMSVLQNMSASNVSFDGWVDDAAVERALGECTALVFPGEEDFGIVPVEAMACGKPVIAYGRGGAAETVLDGRTGILFREQTSESLRNAVQASCRTTFDAGAIRARAVEFDRSVYREKMQRYISEAWSRFRAVKS